MFICLHVTLICYSEVCVRVWVGTRVVILRCSEILDLNKGHVWFDLLVAFFLFSFSLPWIFQGCGGLGKLDPLSFCHIYFLLWSVLTQFDNFRFSFVAMGSNVCLFLRVLFYFPLTFLCFNYLSPLVSNSFTCFIKVLD